MVKSNRDLLKNELFSIGFLIWWFSFFLMRTEFNNYFNGLVGLRYLGLMFVLLSFILNMTIKIKIKSFILSFIILTFTIINCALVAKMSIYFDLVIILICAYGISLVPFFQRCLIVITAMVTLVVICSLLGFIPNNHVLQDGRYRAFLGFNWVTSLSQYFLYIVALIIVVRKRVSTVFLVILQLINFLIYQQTGTKSPFYLITLCILIWLLLNLNVNVFLHKVIELLLSLIMPISVMIIIFLSKNVSRFWSLNILTTGRLYLNNTALQSYPIRFLGQEILMNNRTDLLGTAYSYIDSGFLQFLLNFGVLMYILVYVLVALVLHSMYLKRNQFYILALTLIILNGIFDPQFIQPYFNVFFVSLSILYKPKIDKVSAKLSFTSRLNDEEII